MSILRGNTIFFIFAMAIFVAPFSHAESLRGVVIRRNADTVLVRLIGSTEEPLSVRPVYQSVISQLVKLKSGDIFQGNGHVRELESGGRIVMLESIDFVGLKNLLGTWMASNSALVDFIDFDRVQVQMPSGLGLKRYHLTYSLAPSRESDWMIFLHSSESVILGSLKLNSRTAVIEFIESQDSTHRASPIELIRIGR